MHRDKGVKKYLKPTLVWVPAGKTLMSLGELYLTRRLFFEVL
jgi:hypothetical protein